MLYKSLTYYIIALIISINFLIRLSLSFPMILTGVEKRHIQMSKVISFSPGSINLPVENSLDQHPALSIYFIKLSNFLLGETKHHIRFFFWVASILTILIIYFLAKNGINEYAGIIAMLLLSFNWYYLSRTVRINNDGFLMLFSTLALFYLWLAIKNNKPKFFLLTGIFLGLAYWAKEVIILFIPTVFLYILTLTKDKRKILLCSNELYLSLFLFLIIILPHLYLLIFNKTTLQIYDRAYLRPTIIPSFTGINFFLIRPISYFMNINYLSTVSWDTPAMDTISGILLFLSIIVSFYFIRLEFYRLMIFMILGIVGTFTFMTSEWALWGEHWWANLSLVPAICIAAGIITKLRDRYKIFKYLIGCLVISISIQTYNLIKSEELNYPPHRFGSFVDYDFDLLGWYLENGNTDDAIKEARIALAVCPNEVRAHNYMGIGLARKGLIRQALSEWFISLNIEPFFMPTLEIFINEIKNNEINNQEDINKMRLLLTNFYSGVNSLRDSRYDEALEYFRTPLKLFPFFGLPRFYIGESYLRKGMLFEAKEEFKRAISFEPGFIKAHVELGNIYLKLKEYDKAIEEYRRAININEDDIEAQHGLLRVYIAQERFPDLAKQLRKLKNICHNTLKGYYASTIEDFYLLHIKY